QACPRGGEEGGELGLEVRGENPGAAGGLDFGARPEPDFADFIRVRVKGACVKAEPGGRVFGLQRAAEAGEVEEFEVCGGQGQTQFLSRLAQGGLRVRLAEAHM